jgi:hypothetical protein
LQHASKTLQHIQHVQHHPIYFYNNKIKQLQHTFKTSKTFKTYICNIGEEKGQGSNREIGFQTAPWQAPWNCAGIWQLEHARGLARVADSYLCEAAPDLAELDFVEVVDALAVPNRRRRLLLLTC